jgi:hypothetical protein
MKSIDAGAQSSTQARVARVAHWAVLAIWAMVITSFCWWQLSLYDTPVGYANDVLWSLGVLVLVSLVWRSQYSFLISNTLAVVLTLASYDWVCVVAAERGLIPRHGIFALLIEPVVAPAPLIWALLQILARIQPYLRADPNRWFAVVAIAWTLTLLNLFGLGCQPIFEAPGACVL